MRSVRNRLSASALNQILIRYHGGWDTFRTESRRRWVGEIMDVVKDRPVSQHEMAALVRHFCNRTRRGGRTRCRLPMVLDYLVRAPRPDILTHVRGMEIVNEVMRRNEGAFKRLAKT